MPKPVLTWNKTSIRKVEKTLMDTIEGVAQVGGIELLQTANRVLKQSDSLVPVDTGALQASKFISEVEEDRDNNVVSIMFGYGREATKINPKTGEPTTAYMIKVHEDLVTQRNFGRQAKFFEIPVMTAEKPMMIRLQIGMREYFKNLQSSASMEQERRTVEAKLTA